MRICAACCQELPQEIFSKKQWQLKQYQRRCIECINADRIVQLKAPPKNESTEIQYRQSQCDNADNGGVSCWICLGEGPDESGEPLRRDCSCRGESAGFGHLSCIVKYSEQKTDQWDGRDVNKFSEPWEVCPSCHQAYQDELAVDLAAGFLTFVEGKYPGNLRKKLEALRLKREVLLRMARKTKHMNEAKEVSSEMLSMIGEMKATNPSLPRRILHIEGAAYNGLGRIALGEETKESVKFAVGYFEKYLDISKAIGNDVGVNAAEQNIALAKSIYGGGNKVSNDEEILEKRQESYKQSVETWGEMYKERVEKFGERDQTIITTGLDLTHSLWEARRVIEAVRLLTKLAALCKRVHGPDHRLTKTAESNLQAFNARYVKIKYQNEWKFFQALRYEEDWEKCIVTGPIATAQGLITKPRNTQDEKMFTVATENIFPALGTPVVCHGLESAPHLNGKIGDLKSRDNKTDCYGIHFEDKGLESCSVKRKNIRILFELPDE